MSSVIRLAVDAVVERQGNLLLVEYEDAQFGRHFGLPGGGVEPGEAIRPALIREVLEETGVAITVGRLLLVNEYRPEDYTTSITTSQNYGWSFTVGYGKPTGRGHRQSRTRTRLAFAGVRLISCPRYLSILALENGCSPT